MNKYMMDDAIISKYDGEVYVSADEIATIETVNDSVFLKVRDLQDKLLIKLSDLFEDKSKVFYGHEDIENHYQYGIDDFNNDGYEKSIKAQSAIFITDDDEEGFRVDIFLEFDKENNYKVSKCEIQVFTILEENRWLEEFIYENYNLDLLNKNSEELANYIFNNLNM